MIDLAALGIKVDSTQAKKAADDLNNLKDAGKGTSDRFSELSQRSAELAGKFAGIGIAGLVTGFVALVRGTANAADGLRDLSKTTSLTVEQLTGVKLLAAQTGTSMEGLGHTLSRFNVSIGNNAEKFKQLGIDSKDPLENLARLSDILIAIEDPNKRAAVASEALGRSWQELAPLLSEGGDVIRETVARGQELAGITTQNANEADKFNDAIADLTAQFEGFLQRSVTPAIPLFSQLLDYFTPMRNELDGIKDSVDKLNPVFAGLMQLVAGVGSAFVIVGKSVGAAAAQIEALRRLDFNAITAIQIANDKDVTAEIGRFADFSTKIGQPTQAEFVKPKNKGSGASNNALDKFLGGKDGRSGGGGGGGADINDSAKKELEQFEKKLALYGDTTKAAEVLYDTELGSLKAIEGSLKKSLITSAQKLDSLEAASKAEKENQRAVEERTRAMEQAEKESERVYVAQRKQAEDIAKFLRKNENSELENLREFYDERKRIILENTAVTEMERQELLGSLQKASADAENDYHKAGARETLRNAASTFAELATLTRNNISQQSALYKVAFAVSKAFAIADATMTTYEMANKAYLRGLEIPYVGAVLGPVFAGVALAAGLARVANIASQSPAGGGAFHGGTDYVPKEQSYLLDRGERVLSPKQNEDLTSYLRNNNTQGKGNRSVVINMNLNMNGGDERVIRQSAAQIASRTGLMVNRALERNS